MLGALAGIVGAVMSYAAQQQANQVAQENLQFQKQQAAKQFDLATAARPDAYGDVTSYDPLLNKWNIKLTPTQKNITDAMQRQQLLSQTTDADTARAQRQAEAARGVQAGKLYQKALVDYQYKDQPKELGAYQDQDIQDVLQAQQDQARGTRNDLARLAVRTGQGASLPELFSGVGGAGSGSTGGGGLGQAILAGKEQGRKDYQQAIANKQASFTPVSEFDKIANELSGYTDLQSNVPGTTGNTEDAMQKAIEAALSGGSANVGSAYTALASNLGKSPDFSNIVQALIYNERFGNKGTSSLNAPITSGGGDGSGGALVNVPLPTPRPDPNSLSVADRTGGGYTTSGDYSFFN